MFFIFGTRKFSIKKDGYKNTECKNCSQARICLRWSWFEWGHLFFIPLLPLGRNFSWECGTCGAEPKTYRETSITLKILGFLFLGLITIGIFSSENIKLEANVLIAIKAFLVAVLIGLFYSIIFHAKLKRKKEAKNVKPLENTEHCYLCESNLVQTNETNKLMCPGCKSTAITSE